MKKIFAIVLCVMLLAVSVLPVDATEATESTAPTGTQEAAAPALEGSHVMAIVCGVLVVLGVIYLTIGLKKSKEV